MTFGTFPVGRDIQFVRASLDDVRWVMETYHQWWHERPKRPVHEIDGKSFFYHKVFDGFSTVSDWVGLFLPQNYDPRVLIIDVDAPGWVAILVDEALDYRYGLFGRGLYSAIYERSQVENLVEPNGIAQISTRYYLGEPSLEIGDRNTSDRLHIIASSATLSSKYSERLSVSEGLDWHNYEIHAKGLAGFEGLDLPLVTEIPEEKSIGYPKYLREGTRRNFALGWWNNNYEKDSEASDALQRVLPFDHRGQERIVDFFNSTLVSQWLENTYDIRWNDPSFYEGESLLYIVGGPDVVNDPFTPRIPLEDYYRFQAIDLERNRKLIERGKF